MDSRANVAVDLGGTHLRVAVVEGPEIIAGAQVRIGELQPVGPLGPDLVTETCRLIEQLRDAHPATRNRAIGVGVASGVHPGGGLHEPVPPGVPPGTALKDAIEERFGVPVVIDNDANMAAVGEGRHGAARTTGTFALITLGTNLGMGIVIDGEIYRGASGAAGELGMLPLPVGFLEQERRESILRGRSRSGLEPMGHVWLEEVYGGRALLQEYRRRAADNDSSLAAATGSLKVVEAADAGDPIARGALADAASGWALCVAIIYGILDPGLVLLGGGMSEDLAPHLDLVRSHATRLMVKAPRIELAALGPRAGLVGAASSAARVDD